MNNITIAFISLVAGISLLLYGWLPLFGWVFIIFSIFTSVFSMYATNNKRLSKYTTIIITAIITIIVLIIIAYSLKSIYFAAKATKIDILNITGNIIKVLK